jgi:hypothetical protein
LICLSVYLSICLPVHLSICLSVYLSICLCLSVYLPICPSVYLSICLSVYLFICLPAQVFGVYVLHECAYLLSAWFSCVRVCFCCPEILVYIYICVSGVSMSLSHSKLLYSSYRTLFLLMWVNGMSGEQTSGGRLFTKPPCWDLSCRHIVFNISVQQATMGVSLGCMFRNFPQVTYTKHMLIADKPNLCITVGKRFYK